MFGSVRPSRPTRRSAHGCENTDILLAKSSEGVEDLIFLWFGAPDAEERAELEAELLLALAPDVFNVTPELPREE